MTNIIINRDSNKDKVIGNTENLIIKEEEDKAMPDLIVVKILRIQIVFLLIIQINNRNHIRIEVGNSIMIIVE